MTTSTNRLAEPAHDSQIPFRNYGLGKLAGRRRPASFERLSNASEAEVAHDKALRYGAVLEWRTGWLTGHAETAPAASTTHSRSYPTALETRQSLDLAA